jgi:hypothetical protein
MLQRGSGRGMKQDYRGRFLGPALEEESMQTEAVSSEKSKGSAPTDKDPVLLGVALPISATVSAATQVRNAWMQALMEILAAAKARANEKKAEITKKANGAPKQPDPGEITA